MSSDCVKFFFCSKMKNKNPRFPFNFEISYPIALMREIQLEEFVTMDTFENIDYYFSSACVKTLCFSYSLEQRFKALNLPLPFTKLIAFHIMAINTIYKYYQPYSNVINDIFDIHEDIEDPRVKNFQKLYILNSLMIVENLLKKTRTTYLDEISLVQAKYICCNLRRKVYNLYIFLGFFPITMEQAINNALRMYLKIEELIEKKQVYEKYNLDSELNPFCFDLRLKSKRLLKDYCQHYYQITKKYTKMNDDDEFLNRFPSFYIQEVTALALKKNLR